MDERHSPITIIPGIGYRMGSMILAEIGDFSRFDSPNKLLAYAGMSLSTYQSSQLKNCYPIPTWKGEAPDIYDTPFTTLPSMSATGILLLPLTPPKNRLRASTTMLLYPMPPRSR